MKLRYTGIILSACLVANSLCTASVAAKSKDGITKLPTQQKYTDEEIEKRIDEIGKECIDFYLDAWEKQKQEIEAMSDDSLMFSAAAGGNSKSMEATENEAFIEYDTATEEAADVYIAPSLNTEIDWSDEDIPWNTEEYTKIDESGFVSVATQPFSTFGADVDTASYSLVRKGLFQNAAAAETEERDEYIRYYTRPIEESAIRIEEMINYFGYDYKEPEEGEKFGVDTELVRCPWNEEHLLLRAGIKAEEVKEENKGNNIVFLIDTSGSMDEFDKLPLVKTAMKILAKQLNDDDRVSIVTYAGSEEVLLEGAEGRDRTKITRAFDSMEPWGGTYGEGGIEKAYEIAEKYFIEDGNNRVVLCTDGDFNLGVSSATGLEELISKKRDTGIFFSCLGFGEGNYSDTRMEILADKGNGNYFYIDGEREAKKALEEEFFSTIYTVAKDTKFQVEFNPDNVDGYRLIGYENRSMAAEDFANDKKDGGEVGSGQTVTVLYEIIPAGSGEDFGIESKYGNKHVGKNKLEENKYEDELLTLNIRYKEPQGTKSELREYPVLLSDEKEKMSENTSWAAGVAQAGMLMRGSEYAGTSTFDEIYGRLKNDSEIMDNDYKAEFLYMLRLMKDYKNNH